MIFVLLLLMAGPTRAEVVLKEVRWHVTSAGRGRKTVYAETDRWVQPPTAKLTSKPRAVATLVNRGPRPAEGVLLRYAVSARLVPISATQLAEGAWTIPFWVEERRVPWLKANQNKAVSINSMLLLTYLKRMYRAGYWPSAVRIQVMIEPRAGEALQPSVEQQLSVEWEQGAVQ